MTAEPGSAPTTSAAPAVLGAVDRPARGSRVTGRVLEVRGWAVGTSSPVSRVEALLDGVPLGPLATRRLRGDVAAVVEGADELSGFEGVVDVPGSVGSRRTRLEVEVTLLDGSRDRLRPVPVVLEAPQPRAPRVLFWARSHDRGGSQLRMLELVGELVSRGVEVTVASPKDGPLREALESLGARAEVVDPVPLDSRTGYDDAVAAAALWAEPRGFDLVYATTVTGFAAVEVAARLGVPSIIRVGEVEPLAVVARWLELELSADVEARARRAFALADRVQVNSRAGVALARARGWHGRFVVRSEGTDLTRRTGAAEAGAALRARLGLGDRDRLLLCTGTLWPVKGQNALVDALASVRDDHPALRLALVGSSTQGLVHRLEQQVERVGLAGRVSVHPFERDLSAWYAAADVLVMASESESLSASILEAMAADLPVLATAVGGTPELVVDGRTGWLCEPRDVAALADGLRRVGRASTRQLQALGRRGRRLVEDQHDRSTALPELADLVTGLAAGRARP